LWLTHAGAVAFLELTSGIRALSFFKTIREKDFNSNSRPLVSTSQTIGRDGPEAGHKLPDDSGPRYAQPAVSLYVVDQEQRR